MTRFLPLSAALVAGALSAHYASPDTFEPAAGLLATFSGFVAAAVVPTMVLAATILRPARFSLANLRGYRDALRRQLNFFAGVLVVAACLIAVLVAGEVTKWTPHSWDIGYQREVLLSRTAIINGLVGFLSVLLLGRIFSFVSGVRSLFELHFRMVEQEAADRVRSETERLFEVDGRREDPRSGFGKVLQRAPAQPK